MHEERYEMSGETSGMISAAKRGGRRVIAVGTTTLRVLESVASLGNCEPWHSEGWLVKGAAPKAPERPEGGGPKTETLLQGPAAVQAGGCSGRTRIFIYPPYHFRVVDGLLTNFHLPRSTLLMLASAFAAPDQTRGRELVLSAYAEAIRERYRFFSYGDAMLIL
jgi:S-adenosylmethionine:tRNA ribosyltransferase-isomerase